METPEVEAPEIETPEIEPPEVETPEVEVEGAIEEEVSAPVEETAPAAEGPIDTSVLTVVEVAGSSTAFETLTAALDAADLTESLSGEGPFTVFAPTDEAFAALPEGTLEALLLPENQATLVQILTYHVVPGAVVSTDLETESDTVTTVEGSDITLSVINNGLYVNEAAVLLADVPASNGVVHVINQVILPPELLVQHAAPDAVETPEVSEVPDPSMDAEL
ncbi:MAG: fasciclin domain-containing protein [Cyanobacteria bacterium P01_A01_bin.105]